MPTSSLSRYPGHRNIEPVILVVEDGAEARELSSLTLESQGYVPRSAESAEDALAILSQSDDIDLLLTDICLAGQSGLELATEVRRRFPQLPVVVTSGLSAQQVAPFLGEGMQFLPKPYTLSELLLTVRACLGQGERQAA